MLNLCVVFNEMGDQEYATIESRFPQLWDHCVKSGIINTNKQDASHQTSQSQPVIGQVDISLVDPNLAKTDFQAYLRALAAAVSQSRPKGGTNESG